MSQSPFFSIIIPVYNGGASFMRCLAAAQKSEFADWELIVVDDGSTDGSGQLARKFGARVLRTKGREGPAAARNLAANIAGGRYLFFTDADCELHPDTLTRLAHPFAAEPELDAIFGSYDDEPDAPNFVAQYKNLFHHYVHQTGRRRAATFWTGCGAIKRSAFLELGGFDTSLYQRPAIEDIELGYRLSRAGGRIRLDPAIQVKHLKAWSLAGLLKSDILDRGIPWTRLILRDRLFRADLNLQTHNRISVAAVWGLLAAMIAAFFQPWVGAVALALAAILLWLNLALYRFFYRKRGLLFTLRAIPMHWLYYFYNAIAFGSGLALHFFKDADKRR